MLSTLRDKKTMHIVLWGLLVAFLATIFIAWGAGSTLQKNATDPNTVAKVGDQKITYVDFNKIYQPQLDRLYSMVGEAPSSDQIANLKKHVLDSLVEDAILDQTATKLGVSVSDEELAASLQRERYFMDENGKFSKEKYLQVLQSNQLTPAEFEASQKAQLLLQKIHSILIDNVLYTPDELGDYLTLTQRQLKASYLVLDPNQYEKGVTYTDDDLKDFYESHRTEYDRPERRKVRHILLANQNATNPMAPTQSEKTLEDYRDQVLAGKVTFQDLAKKYSDDPGSKKNGGDLGWVTRGEMVKEFEDAVFDGKKGDITKPFKTQYGYHIAQIVDVEKEHKSTFPEVRLKVLAEYKKEKANQKLLEIASKIGDQIKAKKSIDTTAKDLGLSLGQTSWFTEGKDITGLKDSKNFTQQLANLYPGDWAGPFPLNKKEYFFEVTDAKEPDNKTKETDATQTAQRFMESHSEDWFKNFIDYEKKNIEIKTYLNS